MCICGKPVKQKIVDGRFLKTCGSQVCANNYKHTKINDHKSCQQIIEETYQLFKTKEIKFSRNSLIRLVKEYVFHQFYDDFFVTNNVKIARGYEIGYNQIILRKYYNLFVQ